MELNKVIRFTLVPLLGFLLNVQCTSDDPEIQAVECDCQSASIAQEMKDIEAVVVYIQGNLPPGGNQGPDLYVLSTDPKDFERSSHAAGPNILVPCDSLSTEFRKQGLKVLVSYKRKDCYGAITQSTFHGNYGYFVNLTTIKAKN